MLVLVEVEVCAGAGITAPAPPAAAIAAFAAEHRVNSGFDAARAALAEHFTDVDRNGPLRGAAFVFGDNPAATAADDSLRFRQELVNFGRALLEAT